MRTNRLMAITMIAALSISVAACSSSASKAPGSTGGSAGTSQGDVVANPAFAAGTTMAKLHTAGKVRVGTKFDQPGFGLAGLDGKPAGFDVEIAKLIAGQLGIAPDKIEFVETPSKVREDYIEQDKVDFVVATYTINDKRKLRIDFAGPYYVTGQAIMVRKDDTSITGPDSFQDGTKKVCSVTGSTPAAEIEKHVKDKAAQLVLFDTYDKCRDALKSKQVDAVTTDNVILNGFISKDQASFKLAGDTFTKEPYGIGLKKGDTAFRAFVNDSLEKFAASGRYAAVWKDTAGKFVQQTPSLPAIDRY